MDGVDVCEDEDGIDGYRSWRTNDASARGIDAAKTLTIFRGFISKLSGLDRDPSTLCRGWRPV